jgi:hypothetical protein
MFLQLRRSQRCPNGSEPVVGRSRIGQMEDGRLAGEAMVDLIAAASALVSLVLAGLLRSAEATVPIPAGEKLVMAEAPAG